MSMTHAVHYSRDQLIAWRKSVPLADNVRARVRALKIRTRGLFYTLESRDYELISLFISLFL